MRQSLSSAAANAAVNFSGMCCTMTMPGASGRQRLAGIPQRSVPPVEAPITTTFSVVWIMALGGGLGQHRVGGELAARLRGRAARASQPGAGGGLHRIADA